MRMIINFLLVLLGYYSVSALSACDDIDITFLIDVDSILNEKQLVTQFINQVVSDGSSEYDGFDVIIYGNNIPKKQNKNLLDLGKTSKTPQRWLKKKAIAQEIETAFDKIITAQTETNVNKLKSVSLSEAINIAKRASKPQRGHKKRQKLGKGVGLHDDEDKYFIFDYFNTITDDTMCNLLTEDPEKYYFMKGQVYTPVTDCQGLLDNNNTRNIFFNFTSTMSIAMERIFAITCQAEIESAQYNGRLNLANHVQWIDPDTIIACHLEHIKNERDPFELSNNSYIYAYDYIYDDNTFKLNDYLIADSITLSHIKQVGCTLPVYHINDIKAVRLQNQSAYDFLVLKIFVSFPKTPTEYILNANVRGNVGQNYTNETYTYSQPTYNTTIDAGGRRLLFIEEITSWIDEEVVELVEDGWTWVEDTSISVYEGAVKVAEDFIAALGDLFTIHEAHDTTLINENMKFNRGFEVEVAGDWTSGPLTVEGIGTLKLSTFLGINLESTLSFDFDWDLVGGDLEITLELTTGWSMKFNFTVEIIAELSVVLQALSWEQMFLFTIGPVPVVLKPFFKLDFGLEFIPIRIKAGIDCSYGETYVVSFDYVSGRDPVSESTASRTKDDFTCGYIFEIGSEEENEEDCPVMQLGFDITASLQIGIVFYEIITSAAEGILTVPFRITVPEFIEERGGKSLTASCGEGESMVMSFIIEEITLEVNIIVFVDVSTITDALTKALQWGPSDNEVGDIGEDTLELMKSGVSINIWTGTLSSYLFLGSVTLEGGVLDDVDDYYRSRCCIKPFFPCADQLDFNSMDSTFNVEKMSVGADGTIYGYTNTYIGATEWKVWKYTTNAWQLQHSGTWYHAPAVDISVSDAGYIWVVYATQQPYQHHYINQFPQWETTSNGIQFDAISAGSDGTVYALDMSGAAFELVDGNWISRSGIWRDIAVGSQDDIWGLDLDGVPYKMADGNWISHVGAPFENTYFTQISVGEDGSVFVFDSDKHLFIWGGIEWIWICIGDLELDYVTVGTMEDNKIGVIDSDGVNWLVTNTGTLSSFNLPVKNYIYDTVDIVDVMSFTLDITIHSIPSGFSSLFHVGNTNNKRLPGLWTHPTHGIYFSVNSDLAANFVYTTNGDIDIEFGHTYRIQILYTQNAFVIVIDGIVYFEKYSHAAYEMHSNYSNTNIYISDPWWGAADANVKVIHMSRGSFDYDLVLVNKSAHLGCYIHDNTNNAMDRYVGNEFTPSECNTKCNSEYFGIQQGGKCWCGDSYTNAIQYGVSNDCDGYGNGGIYANDLYVGTMDYDLNDSYVGPFHVGCYTDNINSVRAMDTRYQGPYTIESCNAECNTRYFALQNGGTCWCDDSYDDAIYFDISTNCAGDGLGGPNANDLYVSTNVLSDEISYHWIIVGKQSQWGDIKTPECVPDRSNYASIYTANGYENKIGVGCCNQDGTIGTRPDCLLEATYSEANDKCEEEGLRLCTAIEIYNDALGVGSGCQFDKRYVWTDTKCEYGSDTFYFVKLSNVGGLLKQISVSSDGDVYGMGGFGDGAIFKWHNAGWVRLKNDQNYVSAVTSTTLWMINGGSTPGHIYIGYINDVDTADISWVLKGISPAGNLFTQVASRLVDSVFYTFALDEENNLYQYDVSGTETWISMNTNDYNHITVGSEYSLWGIGTSDGAAYEWKNNEWIYHGFGTNLLKFIDISVSSEGIVIGIDAANYLYFWTGIEWQRIYYDNIAIKQISVGKFESGKIWGVDYSNNIYQITDISPTFEQRHWIIVGKEVFAPGKPPECAYDFSSIGSSVNSYGNKIGVGCCNGTHGFRPDSPDCDSDPSTFFKAELICEKYGYRLCTADEIYTDGMGVGEGCNYDAYHLWTSTVCNDGDTYSGSPAMINEEVKDMNHHSVDSGINNISHSNSFDWIFVILISCCIVLVFCCIGVFVYYYFMQKNKNENKIKALPQNENEEMSSNDVDIEDIGDVELARTTTNGLM